MTTEGKAMLVLSRQKGESIRIGDVQVAVAEIRGDRVRLGIEAPLDVPVHREEVWATIQKEGEQNSNSGGL
jgi:carbon storage regulator